MLSNRFERHGLGEEATEKSNHMNAQHTAELLRAFPRIASFHEKSTQQKVGLQLQFILKVLTQQKLPKCTSVPISSKTSTQDISKDVESNG